MNKVTIHGQDYELVRLAAECDADLGKARIPYGLVPIQPVKEEKQRYRLEMWTGEHEYGSGKGLWAFSNGYDFTKLQAETLAAAIEALVDGVTKDGTGWRDHLDSMAVKAREAMQQ